MTRHAPSLFALLTLAVAGCGSSSTEPLSSEDLEPSEILLTFAAQSNGSTAQIVATARDAMSVPVHLTGGDRLIFSESGGTEVDLTDVDGSYLGQLPTSNTSFTLSFARGDDRTSNPFTLPAPFALSVPLVEAPRSTPIPIVWSPTDPFGLITLNIAGPCISPIVRSLSPDPGSFTLQPADLPVITGACTLDVTVTRGNGSLTQVRQAAIATIP